RGKVRQDKRNDDDENGMEGYHGHRNGTTKCKESCRHGGGWRSKRWSDVHGDGGAEHYVVDTEHWGGGIVDSDCGIQLWAERRERQCKVQRDERNDDYELGSKQHHGHGAQRSDHRQCGGDGGGRGGEQRCELYGSSDAEYHKFVRNLRS